MHARRTFPVKYVAMTSVYNKNDNIILYQARAQTATPERRRFRLRSCVRMSINRWCSLPTCCQLCICWSLIRQFYIMRRNSVYKIMYIATQFILHSKIEHIELRQMSQSQASVAVSPIFSRKHPHILENRCICYFFMRYYLSRTEQEHCVPFKKDFRASNWLTTKTLACCRYDWNQMWVIVLSIFNTASANCEETIKYALKLSIFDLKVC